jgi:hypothetical protein
MLLRTIYERNQMNLILNFKGNSAKRHACASSNICRIPHMVTVWSVEPTTKIGLLLIFMFNVKTLQFFLFRVH